jgi:hypothetical protein
MVGFLVFYCSKDYKKVLQMLGICYTASLLLLQLNKKHKVTKIKQTKTMTRKEN